MLAAVVFVGFLIILFILLSYAIAWREFAWRYRLYRCVKNEEVIFVRKPHNGSGLFQTSVGELYWFDDNGLALFEDNDILMCDFRGGAIDQYILDLLIKKHLKKLIEC